MTLAFEKFMRQYQATGSEKADGYSRDAFIELDDSEKEVVFKLLESELPFSIEWLFFLDVKRALAVAKEEEEKTRGNGYQHVYILQEQLVKHSGDLIYQKRMIEDYPGYVDSLKPLVIDAIGRTPANKAVVDFFKQIVLVEVNDSAVARAARKLLMALKVPRSNEIEERNYLQLLSELRNNNIKIKMKAIAQIERYEKYKPTLSVNS
ncbi:hypothetical protein [Massilia sp. ST3]|uniref:hypothetical protein n=1 Tax=Massilia sp. ST3 TaxID=2824903 RepID=UPI001B8430EF|nr:hypothetical protein [Massilia sp. ST3]MBQ5946157.1 hypothetical protein [Massilia sp. ST3]